MYYVVKLAVATRTVPGTCQREVAGELRLGISYCILQWKWKRKTSPLRIFVFVAGHAPEQSVRRDPGQSRKV